MLKEDSYTKGISVIIPTYKGEKYILKLLNSLKDQTLDYNLFEAIIIINGEKDSTESIIKDFIKKNPKLNINLQFSNLGVSNARNHGISLADREYITFIDDDDFISPNFLEKLYKYSAPNRVVIGTFFDVDQNNGDISESYLTKPLLDKSGIISNPYEYMKDILVITTDKLIPTDAIKTIEFNPLLKSGVDISYFARLYVKYDFEFYIIDKSEKSIYYRLWRDNSISRQKLSYEFNVINRLDVILDINKGFKNANEVKTQFLKSLTVGQVNKINEYLKEFPNDLKRVSHEINKRNFEFFPYKYYNTDFNNLNNENNELVISYAFSPTNTTTSNVMGKRILKSENNVTVISASLDNLSKDHELEKLLDEFINEKIIINQDFSTDWENIKYFVNQGIEKLNKKPIYDKIYSRCYFQHSHFLALEYKLKNKDIFWSAEFSDPTIYDFKKNYTTPPINDEEYVNKINTLLPNDLNKIKNSDTINFICEYLTYIFADEIIFTNSNQKELMLSFFPKSISEIVNKKSKIIPQPILDEKYYYIKESNYEIDKNYVNFAYFGVIFGNRSLEDFINAFDNLNDIFKDKYKLHIFTPNITMFEQILSPEIMKNTILNPVVSFLEFLNLTTEFDCLIVDDTYTKEYYKLNPFLPSKIYDYIGSKKDIWGICEKNSPMDQMNIKYKSQLHNIWLNQCELTKIMLDKTNLKLDNIEKNNLSEIITKSDYSTEDLELLLENNIKYITYLRNRTSHFSGQIYELIQVIEAEYEKNNIKSNNINNLKEEIEKLKRENNEIKNSNSWKITKNLRKIGKQFK